MNLRPLAVASVAVGLIGGATALLVVPLGGIGIVLAVAFAYSYRVCRSDPARLKVGERT